MENNYCRRDVNIQQIIDLVHQTRPIIMNENSRQDITVKGLADFVTKVDTQVQDFLRGALCEAYPDVQFMGEEEHLHQVDPNRPAWILDPIDGTTNLIYDYRHSAVSLGYYEDGRIDAAVLYNPFSGETFHAVRGQGAFLNGLPIHVSGKSALRDSLIAVGTSPYNKEFASVNFRIFQEVYEQSLDIRRGGSAALDLAYVACGRLDGYFERNLKPWDFAAGALLVEEAGGCAGTFEQDRIDFLKNQDVLGTNGQIQGELKALIARHMRQNAGK
ncbi:MAG: inositol monophosphatase [Clostridiales bacterium]|nr:inositol monophosphatase [Clostridiales bacterium]